MIIPSKVLIVDCNAICYASFYAMRHLSSSDDRGTGVIFGFWQMIQLVCRNQRIAHIAFCWDSRKSLRKRKYPAYKAQRDHKEKDKDLVLAFTQFDLLRNEIIPALGFPNNFIRPGFEADDLIAALCKYEAPTENQHYVIMSNDHDLYQLLTDRVSMWKPRTKTLYTKRDFIAEWRVDPFFWPAVKSMAGCSSDNIAGIDGVGEKTAVKYILEFAGIRRHKKIDSNEGKEIVKINEPLVTLPFAGTPELVLDWESPLSFAAWIEMCEEYEFESFLKNPATWEQIFSGISPGEGLEKIRIGGRRPKS